MELHRLLDSKDATSLEYKLDSFSSVYRRLTGKDVVFEFPVVAQEWMTIWVVLFIT